MKEEQNSKQKRRESVRMLTEGAVMVALATVLSFVKLVKFPWGGSITLLSMLPIVIFSLKYGAARGLFVSFVYSLIQLFQGITMDGLLGWGLTPWALFGCIMFDYVLAFTVMGLSGIFGNKSLWGIIGGTVTTVFLRFCLHCLSGVVIFDAAGMIWEGLVIENPLLYSIVYNGLYMLPEMIFTALGATLLLKSKGTRKLLLK